MLVVFFFSKRHRPWGLHCWLGGGGGGGGEGGRGGGGGGGGGIHAAQPTVYVKLISGYRHSRSQNSANRPSPPPPPLRCPGCRNHCRSHRTQSASSALLQHNRTRQGRSEDTPQTQLELHACCALLRALIGLVGTVQYVQCRFPNSRAFLTASPTVCGVP